MMSRDDTDSLPGAAIIVMRSGEVVFSRGYGVADVASGVPIDSRTVFNVGSVSKQFTVLAILMLERDGMLSLDDDVRTHIPELHDFGPTITLEHLARHTSGLKSVTFLARMAGWRQTDLSTQAQMLSLAFAQRELDFAPGADYRYSNTGTLLLAEVVARVSGQSFASFMRERIFAPLGMSDTFVRDTHGATIAREAHSYYWEGDTLLKAINPHAAYGFTNVYSTTSDLARWASYLRRPPAADAALIETMDVPTDVGGGRVVSHGMGQFVTPYRGLRQIQHTGGHRAYTTYLGRFPGLDLAIVICSNLEGFDLFGTAYGIVDFFLAEAGDEALDPGSMPHDEPVRFVSLSPERLTSLEGLYWNEVPGLSRRISVRNDTLIYSRGPDNESPLHPLDDTTFLMGVTTDSPVVRFGPGEMSFEYGDERGFYRRYEPHEYRADELTRFEGVYYSPELNESFRVRVGSEALEAHSPKMRPVTFASLSENTFTSDQWFLSHVRFVEAAGEVIGMRAHNVGVHDVWFKRIQ